MSYNLFIQQLCEVEAAYPTLKREVASDRYILKGELEIVDGVGKRFDNLKVHGYMIGKAARLFS